MGKEAHSNAIKGKERDQRPGIKMGVSKRQGSSENA
jgi:hypothetical protein